MPREDDLSCCRQVAANLAILAAQYVFGQDYFYVLRPYLDFHAFHPFFFLCAVIVDLI